jgi:hypothetical protein
MDRRRYGRQIRLAEIGEQGQERLLAAEVVLGGEGVARDVERKYLEVAGVRTREEGAAGAGAGTGTGTGTGAGADADADADAGADAGEAELDVASLGLRHEAARAVGEGALRALVAMRAVLGMR